MRPHLLHWAMVPAILGLVLLAVGREPAGSMAQESGAYLIDIDMPKEPDASWRIGEVWHYDWYRPREREASLEDADALLILRDAAGDELRRMRIERQWICNGHCYETPTADVELHVEPRATRIELHSIDAEGAPVELKAVRERSPNPPRVEILSPTDGEALVDGMEIRWQAEDADADPLLFTVLYRGSAGSSRQSGLLSRSPDRSLVFARGWLPRDPNVSIAVLANDGFNTVQTQVSGLRLEGNQAPRIWIGSPDDGAFFLPGSLVLLEAGARDPEDGDLLATWSSDLEGPLPSPSWYPRIQGSHQLTARATDADGLASTETRQIFVGPRPIDGDRVYLPIFGDRVAPDLDDATP